MGSTEDIADDVASGSGGTEGSLGDSLLFAGVRSSDSESEGFNGFRGQANERTGPERPGRERRQSESINIVKKTRAPFVLSMGLFLTLAPLQRKACRWSESTGFSRINSGGEGTMVMGWHLSVIELLALRDGALSQNKSRRFNLHLAACRACRMKSSQIEENLRQSSAIAILDKSAASRVDAAAKNLQRAIRTRRRSESLSPEAERRTSTNDADTRKQVIHELEAYLGPNLTAQLVREFDAGIEKDLLLFQKIGPTLTALLGQDASLEVAVRLYRIMVLNRRSGLARSSGSGQARELEKE